MKDNWSRLIKLTVGLLWFILLPYPIFAQQLIITDSLSTKPIEGVFIFDKTLKNSVESDANGKASLNVFAETDVLVLQHPSYRTVQKSKTELKALGYKMYMVEQVTMLEPVNITDAREDPKPDDVPYTMEKIGAEKIAFSNPQNSADMLQSTGSVLIQKSQMGGGSPIIRGFEANKILLVIDGVRMNNAIYRSGHLQNAITVDNNILDRTEILFGPGSVVYGSDALGGVVHFHTKNPILALNDTNNYIANTYARYSSASNEKTGHFDFNLGFNKWGSITSVTASDFGDLRMGSKRPHGYDDWGKVNHYISRIGDSDVILENADTDIQRGTAYKQLDLLQKFFYKPSDSLDFTLNIQYSASTDVPRFDKLNDYNDSDNTPDTLKFAEWYYGPQKRLMTSLRTSIKSKSKFYDLSNIILAYQRLDEDRINRRFNSATRTSRFEDVSVYSFNADFVKNIDTTQKFFYGLESTHNDVMSTAFDDDIEAGVRAIAATRYPDGGSKYSTFAAYISYVNKVKRKATLNLGARYNYTLANSQYNDTSFYSLPYTEIDFSNGALSGSAGITYKPTPQWKFNLVASTGFRNPNIDDYGKVFEKDGFVVVPNDGLRPEYAYNGELSITKAFGDTQKVKLNGTVFYTLLDNAIVRRDFTLNGQDSLIYDGELARIQTNMNASQAVIYGYSATLVATPSPNWTFTTSINYTYGEDSEENVPLAHIPPFFGRTSISFHKGKFHNMLYSMYNGWKRIEDYAGSTDNPSEATVDGTPSWYTINFRTSIDITNTFKAQFGIENILDRHYKQFASAISAPGRNFVVTLRANIQ
jgi:hemoglobin/transferrin/lactoferrin receptor protein